MTANWAFAPVCGVDYWRVIVTSPEVLIFLFFMITDPKTVPAGRVGRVVFGLLVAITSTLLMAPQTDEFGTKVGLLAGLVVMCAARPLRSTGSCPSRGPRPTGCAGLPRGSCRAGSRAPAWGCALRVRSGGARRAGVGAGIVAAGAPGRGVVAAGGPRR